MYFSFAKKEFTGTLGHCQHLQSNVINEKLEHKKRDKYNKESYIKHRVQKRPQDMMSLNPFLKWR